MTTTLDAYTTPQTDRALTLAVMAAATEVQVALLEKRCAPEGRMQALRAALKANHVQSELLSDGQTLDVQGELLLAIVPDVEATAGLSATMLTARRSYGLGVVLNPDQMQPQLRRVLPAGS